MLNPTELMIDAFCERLEVGYRSTFSTLEPSYPGIIAWIGRMAMERIANSDALYHNVEHTVLVTLVGQEIIRGKHIAVGGVTPRDWLHFITALVCHDIGYVRGVCQGDGPNGYVTDATTGRFRPGRGASDAALTPFHVNRGKVFVRERFGQVPHLDAERVAAAIELTRFPVPNDEDHKATDSEAGLVRAADLIGQLADPHYMRKITGLYREFEETGTAKALGYHSAADLADNYPKFFWGVVRPFIGPALRFLNMTQEGKLWIANLYGHVMAAEHHEYQLGPHRGDETLG